MSVSRLLDLSSISWPCQWRCLAQIAESLVDTLDGRSDMQFPRLHFLRHGKLLHSILLRRLHCKDTVCGRTCSCLDSPLQIRPFDFPNFQAHGINDF
jgi:hypothetical protein